jgi:hypothetical protein
MKWFYHLSLSSYERRAKRAGCGRVQLRRTSLGKCSFKLGKAGSAATLSQQDKINRVTGPSFVPALTNVSTVVTPPALAA